MRVNVNLSYFLPGVRAAQGKSCIVILRTVCVHVCSIVSVCIGKLAPGK